METHDKIVQGCAECLWATAWADHVEESGCYNLVACQIEDHMPEIELDAFIAAGRIIGAIEQASGTNIYALLWACLRADGKDPEDDAVRDEHANHFGWDIAHMALGSGVSWFDDHAKCEALKVPYMDGVHIERCEHCPDEDEDA